MPISTGSTVRANWPNSASTTCPKDAVVLLEWPDRAAGFLPGARLDLAFTLSPQLGTEHRNVRITGYGAFAPRAERIAAIRRFLRRNGFAGADAAAHPGRCFHALLRAAGARRARGDPDERAAPARWSADPRRQALQRDRPSGRGCRAVRGDGGRPARARLLGAAGDRRRSRARTPASRRPGRRTGRGGRSAGADRGALRRRGRCAGRAALPTSADTLRVLAEPCRTSCRATTWTRS